MLNLLFRSGITEMYGEEGERVRDAYMEFIASCPIAIRVASGIFISHSLPEKVDRDGFDTAVFTRPLTPADTVRGQYEGYLDVDGVDPKSTTESLVGVRVACVPGRGAGVRAAHDPRTTLRVGG